MRLTLRTLLAYLDDRLMSANARELGQKLASSPLATELANRIKEVVRRRRLADDAARQKTIDANLIAEYLDDQLTPELVALIEKEILASDHSLAEVAATHQILGLLSDPVEIEPSLRERLSGMDPAAGNLDDGNSDAQLGTAGTDWQPLAPQLETSKRSPMILLTIMVLGWLGLLATDADLFNSRPSETTAIAVNEPDPLAAPAPAADQNPLPRIDGQPAVTGELTEPSTTAQSINSTSEDPADPALPGEPEDVVVAENKNSAVPDGPKDSSEPEPQTDPADMQDLTTAGQLSPAAPTQQLHLTDDYAMTIISSPDDAQWHWATSLVEEQATDWNSVMQTRVVGIAEPYSVIVENHQGGWSTIVRGSSLFAALKSKVTGIRLFDGRMTLLRSALAGQPTEAIPVGIGGRILHFSVPEVGQRIGIHVVPLMEVQADVGDVQTVIENHSALLPFNNPSMVFIFAAAGDVVVRVDETENSVIIRRGSMLQWDTNSDTLPDETAAQTTIVPDWVIEPPGPQTDATKKLLTQLATGFAKDESVTDAALSLNEHRNPQIAAFAMKLPVLLRKVDELAVALLQSESQVVRRESIMGLQQVLYQSSAGGARIRAALETRLPERNLEEAMRLLEGVSRTAAEERDVCEWLVSMLDSKRVALRELAIYNLERITGEDQGFFAGDSSGRVAAVRRWQRILSRNNGGLVMPVE
ncbi:MAG: hypothetical protein GY903_11190 [Fuerstiella sp.]|nr:hypothetical protein [Fuerstiella sp.]